MSSNGKQGNTAKGAGMATESQLTKITELTTHPDFKMPLVALLKSVTNNRVTSIDELTRAQADDVLNVFKKFTKKSK